METVTSADGTTIAIETTGEGRPVIAIGGAFNDRSTVAALAAALAPHMTVVTYDRRGRGASGQTGAWTGDGADREIEDLAAVMQAAGRRQGTGTADLFGHSSGAVLALEATQRGLPVGKVAVYEPSYVTDESVANGWRPRPAAGLADRIAALAQAGQRDEAVEAFLTQAAAVPPEMVAGMRAGAMWDWFTGLAHTLPYDVALGGPGLVLPAGRFATISVPVLAIGGGQSPQWLPAAARAVAGAIPGARYVTLDGQDHGVLNQPETLLPLLTGFYAPDR
ncbi:MAG TPA: alpha/beta hydrolase [Streptosporangiaceae bacterium]|jgi:pimeloyl-ACP methyl ester carboxylesterase